MAIAINSINIRRFDLGLDAEETRKFRECFQRLKSFRFSEDESVRCNFSLTLDEVIAVDPSFSTFEYEFEVSELLSYLSSQVPFHYDRLVTKYCQLIIRLCSIPNISLHTRDIQTITSFLINGLFHCPPYSHVEILSAFATIAEGNTHRLQKFHDDLLGGKGVLIQLTDDTTIEEEVVVEAVKCLAALTCIKPNQADCIEVRYLSACFDTLVHLLHRAPHMVKVSSLHSKLLIYCFTGIQNIFLLKRLPNIELGILFAAVRAYMFYGLTSHPPNIPSQLFPNVVTPFDPLASSKGKLPSTTGLPGFKDSKGADGERGKGKEGRAAQGERNKNKRQKKKKGRGGDEEEEMKSADGDATGNNSMTGASVYTTWSSVRDEAEALSWEMNGLKISSSDSEFSDSEGAIARHQKSDSIRVRHAALNCFLNIVKTVDKKVMFGFWSSFLPDCDVNSSTPAQTQSLFTTILKDPAPKCRLAALSSLTGMLESTRTYMAVAEDISPQNSAFTPFSVVLGIMIKEMHRCLLQALVAESYKTVLTQVIKCIACLVSNVPYHRLQPGLLTRVMKQNRHFLNHKDPNVRTAALTCIGAVVGIRPPLMEVSTLIKPHHPPVGVNKAAGAGDSLLYRAEDEGPYMSQSPLLSASPHPPSSLSLRPGVAPPQHSLGASELGEVSGASQNMQEDNSEQKLSLENSVESGEPKRVRMTSLSERESGDERSDGSMTPVLGGGGSLTGFQTPVFTDQMLQAHASQTSWVIKLCMRSIMGQPESREDSSVKYEPLPIRIEGLQVISSMIKNYFPMMRSSFYLIQNLVQVCFEDENSSIKLHGAKVLDELTQALQKDVQDAGIAPTQVIPIDQIFEFWQQLLSGPLPTLLNPDPTLSVESSNAVRAAACECMANIGEDIFAKLPMRRQVQCMTLVLGLANDDDKLIKASSTRALGVYVMYSSLRTDVAFIMDASKAILGCMTSTSNIVRFKASWALANICDSLVSNKQSNQQEFLEDFPDSLLLQLLQQTGSSVKDSDKVSCNAARAIGNILKYLPEHCFKQPEMLEAIEKAVTGLVKSMSSGTMKVRWNSCYAASNAFQNAHLPKDKPWLTQTVNALSKVVHTCSNFKVRINAAIALAAPSCRQSYGSSETFSNVWSSLALALETAENINDFAEYKYKDLLVEHVCSAVLHIMVLMDASDLSAFTPSVQAKGHFFRQYLEKYVMQSTALSGVPSVAEVLAHLESLQVSTDDQRRCQQALLELFAPDLDTSEERSPEKMNFQQTYD